MKGLMSGVSWWNLGGWTIALGAAITSGACASSGAVPHPFPMSGRAPATVSRPALPEPPPGPPSAVEGPLPNTKRDERPAAPPSREDALVAAALALRGAPYRNGGDEPDGFDCSGFTRYV